MAKQTEAQLDMLAARDAVSSFMRVQARDWHRRQMNRVWTRMQEEIEQAWADGNQVDVAALVRQIFSEPERLT